MDWGDQTILGGRWNIIAAGKRKTRAPCDSGLIRIQQIWCRWSRLPANLLMAKHSSKNPGRAL